MIGIHTEAIIEIIMSKVYLYTLAPYYLKLYYVPYIASFLVCYVGGAMLAVLLASDINWNHVNSLDRLTISLIRFIRLGCTGLIQLSTSYTDKPSQRGVYLYNMTCSSRYMNTSWGWLVPQAHSSHTNQRQCGLQYQEVHCYS